MKIIAFEAENYKRLKSIRIEPDENGAIVTIAGNNEQGKTSVMDAIWAALEGAAASRANTKPIRRGEDSARVFLDLGDYTVERIWPENKLILRDTSGRKLSAAQTTLNDMVGSLSFDPLEFAEADQKQQRRILLGLIGVDLDSLDSERKAYFDRRTDINRSLKQEQARLSKYEGPKAGDPTTEPKVADLVKELQEAEATAVQLEAALNSYADVQGQIKELESKLATIAERGAELRKASESLRKVEDIQTDIDQVETLQRRWNELQAYSEVSAAVADLDDKSTNLSESIKKVDAKKADALKAADMPVPDLSVDEDGVIYQGVPFAQASAAGRLRVSTAIGMALNPDLRIIQIRDGSLLDKKNLGIIEELAVENDFQVWIERVGDEGYGFVIEDGELKA